MGRFQAEARIKIPFHDVDLVSIVWHGHYLKYFEVARTELMRKFNYDVDDMKASNFGWPIIEAQCRYIKPAYYGMEINVLATVVEVEYRLKVKFVITDAKSGERLCKGHTTQVGIDMDTMEMCLASPDVLLEKFGVTCDEDL